MYGFSQIVLITVFVNFLLTATHTMVTLISNFSSNKILQLLVKFKYTEYICGKPIFFLIYKIRRFLNILDINVYLQYMDFIAHTRMRAGIENTKFHYHKPKPSSGSRDTMYITFMHMSHVRNQT